MASPRALVQHRGLAQRLPQGVGAPQAGPVGGERPADIEGPIGAGAIGGDEAEHDAQTTRLDVGADVDEPTTRQEHPGELLGLPARAYGVRVLVVLHRRSWSRAGPPAARRGTRATTAAPNASRGRSSSTRATGGVDVARVGVEADVVAARAHRGDAELPEPMNGSSTTSPS